MFMCGPAFWQQFPDEEEPPVGVFTIYEGYTDAGGEVITGAATIAQTAFLNAVSPTITAEDFESYDLSGGPVTINSDTFTHNGIDCTFGGDIILAINIQVTDVTGNGRFNTTSGGSQWADGILMSQDYPLEFNFSSPIAAFGLFITDLGDFGVGAITQVRLTKSAGSGGGTSLHNVTTSSANANGTLHFWGFTDGTATYDKVELLRDVSSVDDPDVLTDAIGIDDLFFAPASYLL